VRLSVEGSRIEDGDSVPARLDLNGEMVLEPTGGFRVVEDVLEGCVLESGSVDVSGDPEGVKRRVGGKG